MKEPGTRNQEPGKMAPRAEPLRQARDLEVYKKAFSAALEIHKASDNWPKYEIYGGLADQVRRASRGICANLVEGLAKSSSREQSRFLEIAIGSTAEVRTWIEFAAAFGYVQGDWSTKLDGDYAEIGRMLFGLKARRIQSNENGQRA